MENLVKVTIGGLVAPSHGPHYTWPRRRTMTQTPEPDEAHNKDKGIVTYGPSSTEFEDYLYGDRRGLEALAEACKTAIREGKHTGWVGDFPGIVCKETSFFDEDTEPESSGIACLGCFIVIAGLGALLVLGVVKALELIG